MFACQREMTHKLLRFRNGGAEGSRTPDLLIANETLYQLSYDPIQDGCLQSAPGLVNRFFGSSRVFDDFDRSENA